MAGLFLDSAGMPGATFPVVACSLRRVSPTTWEAMNDAGHLPVGVQSVTVVTADRVRVAFDFTASRVLTFMATLDEAFASSTSRMRVGASVGLNYADVFFYTDASGSTPVDPGLLSRANANVWIFGVFEVPGMGVADVG